MKEFYTILLCLFIFSYSQAQKNYVEKATKLMLPATIGNCLTQDEITDYEKVQKGYGVGIDYIHQSKDIVASLYIYNLNLKEIANSSEAEIMTFEDAESELVEAEKQGYYKDLKKIEESSVYFSDNEDAVKALFMKFTFKTNKTSIEKISLLYVTTFKNNFVKIRYTYSKSLAQEAENCLKELLTYLDDKM